MKSKSMARINALTPALAYPYWDNIRDEIEEKFRHGSDRELWAIDAVSAHLMLVPDRAQRSLQMLGADAAQSVHDICAKYGITLPAYAAPIKEMSTQPE